MASRRTPKLSLLNAVALTDTRIPFGRSNRADPNELTSEWGAQVNQGNPGTERGGPRNARWGATAAPRVRFLGLIREASASPPRSNAAYYYPSITSPGIAGTRRSRPAAGPLGCSSGSVAITRLTLSRGRGPAGSSDPPVCRHWRRQATTIATPIILSDVARGSARPRRFCGVPPKDPGRNPFPCEFSAPGSPPPSIVSVVQRQSSWIAGSA